MKKDQLKCTRLKCRSTQQLGFNQRIKNAPFSSRQTELQMIFRSIDITHQLAASSSTIKVEIKSIRSTSAYKTAPFEWKTEKFLSTQHILADG
jgi:hypothetical protein